MIKHYFLYLYILKMVEECWESTTKLQIDLFYISNISKPMVSLSERSLSEVVCDETISLETLAIWNKLMCDFTVFD